MAKRPKKLTLTPVAVGGGTLPTVSQQTEIEKDLEEKLKIHENENPQKPKSNIKPIQAPLNIPITADSLDNEYIELAKRYAKIPSNKKVTLVDFAKIIIKLFNDNIDMYKKLQNSTPKSNRNRVLSSSDSNGFWN